MTVMCAMTLKDESGLEVLQNEKLFCFLYKHYFEKMFNHALSYCRDQQIAEDCVQDVFLKVSQHLHTFQQKITDLRRWHFCLFVMTRNRASNLMRGRKVRIGFLVGYAKSLTEVIYDDVVLEKECDRVLTAAISELSVRQKEIFTLKYSGFKPRVIAKELALSSTTVRNTLGSARKIMVRYVRAEFGINESLVKMANEISHWS